MARMLMVAPDGALLKALRASPLLEGHAIEVAGGDAAAIRRLRQQAFDVLVTAPDSDLEEDTAILDEVRLARPGVKIVLLAPRTTPELVIEALRKRVFACFSAPFDAPEIADMLARALEAGDWKDGIEVLSATPDWMHVRVELQAPERGAPRQLPDRAALGRARGPPRRLHVRVPRGAHERHGARRPLRPGPGGGGHWPCAPRARWSSTCATRGPGSTWPPCPTPRSTRPDDPLAVAEIREQARSSAGRLRPPARAADRGRDALQRASQRGHPHQAPAVSATFKEPRPCRPE